MWNSHTQIFFSTEHKKSKKFTYTEDEDEEKDVGNVTVPVNGTHAPPGAFSGSRIIVLLSACIILIPNLAYLGYILSQNATSYISQYERNKKEEKQKSLQKLSQILNPGGNGQRMQYSTTDVPSNLTESLKSIRLSQMSIGKADKLAGAHEWRSLNVGSEAEGEEAPLIDDNRLHGGSTRNIDKNRGKRSYMSSLKY